MALRRAILGAIREPMSGRGYASYVRDATRVKTRATTTTEEGVV
jgi:hypothetical protein